MAYLPSQHRDSINFFFWKPSSEERSRPSDIICIQVKILCTVCSAIYLIRQTTAVLNTIITPLIKSPRCIPVPCVLDIPSRTPCILLFFDLQYHQQILMIHSPIYCRNRVDLCAFICGKQAGRNTLPPT